MDSDLLGEWMNGIILGQKLREKMFCGIGTVRISSARALALALYKQWALQGPFYQPSIRRLAKPLTRLCVCMHSFFRI